MNTLTLHANTLQSLLTTPPRIGIQGGAGSFNHRALQTFVTESQLSDYTTHYLYTTKNVLTALNNNSIDLGIFAIHNNTGGMVQETMEAIGEHTFSVVANITLSISHTLSIHPESSLQNIDTILTHPQVIHQCKKTLIQRYPDLTITSGTEKYIDHAAVAEGIASGHFPPTVGVIGPEILAETYGLQIIDTHLEDSAENTTTFLVVQ